MSAVDASVEQAVAKRWLTAARRLVFAGSGDSLFAALSVLPALRRWSGLSAQAMTSLELARYETALLEPDDVLVAISNSGSSSRTREAIAMGRASPRLCAPWRRHGPIVAIGTRGADGK